jgi:hypothetical protein
MHRHAAHNEACARITWCIAERAIGVITGDGRDHSGPSGTTAADAQAASNSPPRTADQSPSLPIAGFGRTPPDLALDQVCELVLLASILLFVISFFNMLFGIAAIANSHVFVAGAHYVIGDLRAWGWVTLIIAAVQFIAACGVLAGNQLARWFAVAVVGINAIEMMFFIPAYPFWALVIIAADVVALWGLCAYGSRANLEAA